MTTANDLCIEGLKTAGLVGLGQSAQREDINRIFLALNAMLAQWQRRRWLIWHLIETAFTATAASQAAGFMTVGPAGNFALSPRPDRIEFAWNRQTVPVNPNAIDYPLEEMKSYEDWGNVALKSLASFPSYFFYDSGFPSGKLYVWPVPQASLYEIHILTKESLGQFATTATAVNLPLEYTAAIQFNLARRARAMWRKPADPELNALARDATNVIRMANTQIARLTMPSDLVRPGIFNIFSDQIR